ncbi:hypothetical protein WOLCODRAFT_74016 [Wolfiporia cocos MD-104 SS10]|uniref:F-box domain-containing protein n=1 Tax=Wolfiporia cocos (strain MD-104) TaxID=742152 RepID=A0A2H3K455_WOLCO|nr:hypothetical protein WOLCODRAFT_74016 [Wolfiporia cocos MD-104 SS10]
MLTAPPIEICEAVIDCVWNDCTDRRVRRRTLLACALTCKSWLIRSRRYLFREISLRSSAQLHSFSELLGKVDFINDYVKEVEITDPQVLLSFASVLARKLTGVESLIITHRHAQLFAMVQPLTFAPLPDFVAISSLQVQHVVFANFTDFERLLCALPRLSRLSCIDVMWNTGSHNPLISSRKAPCLRSLELELCPLQKIISWIIAVNATSALERIILPFVTAEELEWVGQLLAHTQATLQHLTLVCHDSSPNSTSLMRAVGKVSYKS